MNGRKPTRPNARPSSSNGKSVPFEWINISLTDQDIDILEREEANLEQLALAYISLGVQRLGLSVKYDLTRKSYTVSIYGCDMGNDGKPCGISSSAAELRDALLVSLYRFNFGLQGSFDGRTSKGDAVQSKRFR